MVAGPRKERRAGNATKAWKRPIETSSTITWEHKHHLCQDFIHQQQHQGYLLHLEECADESEVLIGKDDHTQEGGESSVKDMGASPEMSIVLISRLP